MQVQINILVCVSLSSRGRMTYTYLSVNRSANERLDKLSKDLEDEVKWLHFSFNSEEKQLALLDSILADLREHTEQA